MFHRIHEVSDLLKTPTTFIVMYCVEPGIKVRALIGNWDDPSNYVPSAPLTKAELEKALVCRFVTIDGEEHYLDDLVIDTKDIDKLKIKLSSLDSVALQANTKNNKKENSICKQPVYSRRTEEKIMTLAKKILNRSLKDKSYKRFLWNKKWNHSQIARTLKNGDFDDCPKYAFKTFLNYISHFKSDLPQPPEA